MVPWYDGQTERSSYEIGVASKVEVVPGQDFVHTSPSKPRDVLIDPGAGNPNPATIKKKVHPRQAFESPARFCLKHAN